jgi:hypothetical protein
VSAYQTSKRFVALGILDIRRRHIPLVHPPRKLSEADCKKFVKTWGKFIKRSHA